MESVKKFADLGLEKDILAVLKQKGFKEPTEIQEKAIPLTLEGKDIIGGSATGSGKTLAFASSIIQNLKPNGNVQAVVLTPTRELAEQVADSFKLFSKLKGLKIEKIYGGVGIDQQIRALRDTDIVIGTPGRILDHLERRTLNLRQVKTLVLDEADRMFDMGFHHDVEKIIYECPKERQTMLFSATISADIDYLAKKHTNNPIEIAVKSYIDPSKLKQVYYDVPNNLKFSLLVHLLKSEKSKLVMVFCSSRMNVDFVTKNLQKIGIYASSLHGGMSQNKRNSVLKGFHNNKVDVLVCTDVAARGLDIPQISHVYNYDLPRVKEDYVHRIGRTARAGKEGIAINLLSDRDYENFGRILENDNLKIERKELPKIERVTIQRTNNSRRSGDSRGRNSKRPYKGKQNSRGSHKRGSGPKDKYSNNNRDSRGRDSGRGESRDGFRGRKKPTSKRNSSGRSSYSRK